MNKTFAIYCVVTILVTFLVRENPFFWDTVQLASKHGQFFFENNFSSLLLPVNIDSGHIPAFGMYIAFCWKLFGKSLMVSHFAMIPFLIGIGYYLLKIGEYLGGEKKAHWLLILCFADPVLASQSILVSPDVALVFFFLMGIHTIWLKKSKWYLVVAVLGLGLISMRGMMLTVGLFFFSLLIQKDKTSIKHLLSELLPFLPGGVIAGGFLLFHFFETGWIGYHPDSPWAPSYERVGASGFLKNVAVFGWRLLDFGRIFVCVGLIIFIKRFLPKNINSFPQSKNLLLLVSIVFLVTVPMQFFYKALLAHRYLLPFFITLHFLLFYFLFGKEKGALRESTFYPYIYPLVITSLILGNLWVYPKKISQGWDSTLAHVNWYYLQKDVQRYMDEEEISMINVGTAFPNIGPRNWYDLKGQGRGYVSKDFASNCYIFYSNIMNDFSDEEIDQLEREWHAVYHREQMGVCAILYKNPNQEICEN